MPTRGSAYPHEVIPTMSMTVRCLEVGQLGANCYVVACGVTRKGFIVDPGGDAEVIVGAVKGEGLQIEYILDTHCHPDHIAANCAVRDALREAQRAAPKLLVHGGDREAVEHPPMQWLLIGLRPNACTVDGTFSEGDELRVGELTVRVMHLPGHSPGSVALVVAGAAFTGDTLFAGGIGRTDLPGGNTAQIMESLKRLVTELPPETAVYPGHGESSTIGEERERNEWLAGM